MKKRLVLGAVALGGTAIAWVPVSAQEPSGASSTFRIDQRLETASNLGMEIPSEGNTTLATTSLGYSYVTQTETQSLSFGANAKLRAGSLPTGSDTQTGFAEPRLTLRYGREGVDSKFNARVGYREDDVTFLRPLLDFVDDDGLLILPEDAQDLFGAGTRKDTDLSVSLKTGIDAPLGFNLSATHKNVTYDAATSAGLVDFERNKLSAGVDLKLSEVTTATAGLSYSTYNAEDSDNTERNTTEASVGFRHDLSPSAQIGARIGYSEIESTESGVTTTETGPVLHLDYKRDMVNGTLTAAYDTRQNKDGTRHTLRLGRELSFPVGQLNTSIGATKIDGGDTGLVGGIRWEQELPTGSVNVNLKRDVRTTNNDAERITTSFGAGYSYTINDISSVSFNASYGLFDDTSDSDKTTRTDVSVNYNHALTEDWNLNAGVSYRVRDEDSVGKADSTSIYVGIGRSFKVFH